MSNLLEQAFIDAAALKEAAMKNAENALIEKYSSELKENMQKLLEMEAALPDPVGSPMELSNDAPETSLNPATDQTIPTDLGGQPASKKIDGVPSAFLKDDESLVEINFDELEEKPEEAPMDIPQDDTLEMEPGEFGLEDSEPTPDGQEIHQTASENPDPATANFAPNLMEEMEDIEVEEEPITEEKEELTDEEIDTLAEELVIDMVASPNGSLISNQKEKDKEADVLAARMRDQEIVQKTQEELSKVKDLFEAAKCSEQKKDKKIEKLKEENKDLLETVETLRETLEKTNVLNAKLLYTNKTLGNASLNERQKMNIVEAISKTKSVEQAKIIYETLQSTVKSISEKAKLPESLSEAINRTQVVFARKDTIDSNPEVKRNQLLAGIIKG